MQDTDRYHVEHLIREFITSHEARTRPQKLMDDYEGDCIELWDAIEKLQEENKRLQAIVRQLILANGIIIKEATT